MSVTLNDAIQANAPKSLDNKYLSLGVVPYTNTTDANTTILSAYRSRGLTVLIGAAEYWYRDDIGDVNLIPKGIPSVISPLSIDPTTQILSIALATNSTSGYLSSADWTAFNAKLSTVATANSVTNTGVSGNPITLVNDSPTPGFSKMYSTNGSGVKGWYPIPVASGGGGVWGSITGTLSDQTDVYNLIQSKEPGITVGTTSQYWRGDKSWQTLNTSVVPEGSNPYFTTARARASVSAGTGVTYNSTTGVIASLITQADGSETKLTAGTNIIITGTGTTVSPYIINTTGGGTVTSVGLTSTDLTVSGSPITASGSITANLGTTGVTAGSYTLTALTVDAKGRITAATNGSIPTATSSVLGLVKIGTNISITSGVISVAFPNPIATSSVLGYVKIGSGVSVAGDGTISVAGYSLPIASSTILGGVKVGSGLAIDGTGVLSSTAGGGSVTSVAFASTDFTVTGSPITGSGTITSNLTATGVGAGTYNSLTVDTKGRVTAASVIAYLTGNQTITLSGDTTGSGTTAITTTLSNTGVTAGTYNFATITVDAKGRISSAVNHTAVTSVALTSSDLVITGSPITSSGTFTATLGTVNANVGTFNNVTVNAKGLVTAASNASYISANQTITLSGDVAGSGTTAITATIQPTAVTYTKIQNVTASTLLGRYTASPGSVQEITLGAGLTLNSSTGVLSGTGVSNNIYTADGTLLTNRVVSGAGGDGFDGYNLTFAAMSYIKFDAGVVYNVNNIADANYTIKVYDYLVNIPSTSITTRTLTFPSSPVNGSVIIIRNGCGLGWNLSGKTVLNFDGTTITQIAQTAYMLMWNSGLNAYLLLSSS